MRCFGSYIYLTFTLKAYGNILCFVNRHPNLIDIRYFWGILLTISEMKMFLSLVDFLLTSFFGNKMCQTWSKQLENEGYFGIVWGGLFFHQVALSFLLISSPGHRQCELLSLAKRPLSVR